MILIPEGKPGVRLAGPIAEMIDDLLRADPNIDLNQLAREFDTTYSAVWRRRNTIERVECNGRDYRRRPGPNPLVTPEIAQFAQELLIWDPTLYLDEVADHIYMEYAVVLDNPQISRLWKAAKVSRKKNHVTAAQQNDVLIAAWDFKMCQWDSRRLVFLDESASNERTGDRRWGWAPLGVPPKVKRWLGKGERYSILPTYTLDGWLDPLIVQGGITAEIFEWWLKPRSYHYATVGMAIEISLLWIIARSIRANACWRCVPRRASSYSICLLTVLSSTQLRPVSTTSKHIYDVIIEYTHKPIMLDLRTS